MSKGHMEAMAALKAMLGKPRRAESDAAVAGVTKLATKPVTKIAGRGRPKVHASAADRQRASRARKAAKA